MTLQTKLPGSAIQTGTISVTAITNFSGELSASLPPNVVSSSAQVKTFLPTDTVSSSAQVTAFLPTGTVSSSGQLPAGIASSSAQVIEYLPTNVVSSSGQVTAFLPTGTVSSSTQVDVFTTTGGNTLATTGSNTFTAAQTISDTTNSTSYLDGALHIAGGMSVRKDVRVSGSLTVNGLLTAVSMSTQYVTASEYTIGTSKILLNDDDLVRFAGLSIVDSGSSSPTTASIYWDSLQHRFIYENLSGSSYNSSIIMAGPKHTGTLGDEVGLTDFRVPVAHGSDHIDSRVASSSIRVDFPSKLTHVEAGLYVTGAISASDGINAGSGLFGTLQTAAQTNITSLGTLSSLAISGNLTVDTNTLYVDATNNRVGVGTVSPTAGYQLDVIGRGRFAPTGTNYLADFISPESNGTYLQIYADNSEAAFVANGTTTKPLGFYVGGSKRVTIDTSGNLGLGVTPSAWQSAWKVLETQGGFLGGGGTTYIELGQNIFYDGAFKYKANGLASLYEQSAGLHKWYLAPNNTSGAGAAATLTQAMTLDASGNLCVGRTTTVNNARFMSAGASVAYGVEWSNDIYMTQMYFDSTYYMGLVANAAGREARLVANSNDGNGKITFYTGGSGTPTERMRITAGGHVGIKITPNGSWGSSMAALQLGTGGVLSNWTGANANMSVGVNFYDNGAGSQLRLYAAGAFNIGLSEDVLTFSNAASSTAGSTISFTERMRITSTGNVGIGTTNPSTTLHVNGNTRTDVVFGASHYSGTVATNISAGQSGFWCVATNTGGSGEPASQMIIDVIASSWTVWNLCRIIIDKRYDSSTVVASITGYTNSTVTVSVVTVNVGGTNYVAIRRTGADPGLVVHAIQNGQGLTSAFHTTSGTVVTTHASYP